jgi:hypothetical protein
MPANKVKQTWFGRSNSQTARTRRSSLLLNRAACAEEQLRNIAERDAPKKANF